MYVLIVSYTKQPDVVSEHQATHVTWVKKYIAEGIFLAAGPKASKLGGAILVRSIDKAKLKAIIAEDSFVIADVVDYDIIDVNFIAVAAGFESLMQA